MIRIYIHGRPQGQDTWCAAPEVNDKFYLKPFLESRIGEDMDAVLQIDVWQQNTYYSFIHRKNVREKGNRPDAYFAITVCFEKQICSRVATLYDLLDSVYNQICLSNLIENDGENARFLVSQFKEKESVLNQITSVILQNIDKYIATGLQTLESKKDTVGEQIRMYSTVDVDSPQFISDCERYRVLVSPLFVAKDEIPVSLKQQIVEVEKQCEKVSAECNQWQIEAEKEKKANAQLTIDKQTLQEQKKGLEANVQTLNSNLSNEIQKNNALTKELAQFRNQKNPTHPHPQKPIEGGGNGEREDKLWKTDIQEQLHRINGRICTTIGKISFGHSLVVIVVSVINTCLLIALLCICLSGKTVKSPKDNPAKPDYSAAQIDIMGYNGNDSTLNINTRYGLKLVGAKGPQTDGYSWDVSGSNVDVKANTFEVKEPGVIIISCVDKNKKIVKTRKIKAQ